MAIKEIKIIVLILFLIKQNEVFAQNCGAIEKYIAVKTRNYYLLDSNYTITLEEISAAVKPKDTSLVKQIIDSGTKSEDYVNFFQRKGIAINRIGLKQFSELPRDSVIFTRREERLKRKYERLTKKMIELSIAGKSYKTLNERLGKPKFLEIHDKILSSNPYLFKIYPVYTYKNYTLIMYGIFTSIRVGIPFIYEICVSE